MGTTERHVVALLLLLVAACRPADRRAAPQRVTLASFSGAVDSATGAVTIRAEPTPGSEAQAHLAAVELPVVSDGAPGSGPPDTIELVTEQASTVPGGCGAVDGFEGAIRLRSFFAGAVLANVHVELVTLTPTGREACNSSPATGSVGDDYGLWSYGTVGRAGAGFDAVLRSWRFRLPDQTRFNFRGHVVGDLVTSDPTPPSTEAFPGAGAQPPGTSIELRCTDAETGCAATYYTTDGTEPTTASTRYTGPVPLTSSLTLRYFSLDYWGNVEAVRSASYVLEDPAPIQVSGQGSATLEPGGIAFDSAGDGLAVWRTDGQKIAYACYSAASASWSEAGVLDGGSGSGYQAPRVAAGPGGFAVAWIGKGVQATVLTGCTPGSITTLATGLYGNAVAVGSNGSGYLVVWAGSSGGSQAAMFEGGAWVSAGTFTTDTYPETLALAGEGTGYRVVYRKSGHAYAVQRASGAWGTRQDLGYATGGTTPAVASAGSVTCMAWQDSSTYARVEQDGTGTTSMVITGTTGSPAVAINGGRCRVVAAGAETGASAVLHDGGSWSQPVSLGISGAVTSVGVAPWGASEFAAVASGGGDAWVSRSAGGTWGAPARVESASPRVRYPFIAASSPSSVDVLYEQADANADQVWTARCSGNGCAVPGVRSTTIAPGNASAVQLAAAANGDALAIWTQQHLGTSSVFWAYRQGQAWSPAQLLAADAQAAAIASNGTDFMIAYTGGLSGTLENVVRRFSGGGFGAPTTLASGSTFVGYQVLASDGSGYAIAYVIYPSVSDSNQPVVRILDGGSWSAEKRLTGYPGRSTAVSLAGRPGEYLAAWVNQTTTTVSAMSWRATKAGATWSWDAASRTIASGTGYSAVALAAGPTEFMALWSTSTGVSSASMSGGAWTAPALLRSGASTYAIASNGSTYLAATSNGSGSTQVHAFTSAWQAARDAGWKGSFTLAVSSDGAGYGVVADGTTSPTHLAFIPVPDPVSQPIGTPVVLDTAVVYSSASAPARVVAAAGGYLTAWVQRDPADASVKRVYARGGL